MHPQIRQTQPGNCPICGMALILEGSKPIRPRYTLRDFLPLIVIFAVVFALTALMLWRAGSFSGFLAMRYFEGFFFLVFGVFKLLNWKGFAEAFATYDLLAKRSHMYALLYPLIELALAAGYLFAFQLRIVAAVTLVLMLIGSAGVAKELRKKNQIMCACLGVVFKIPMTYVTLVEDLVMAVMAAVMLLIV